MITKDMVEEVTTLHTQTFKLDYITIISDYSNRLRSQYPKCNLKGISQSICFQLLHRL